MNRLADKVCVAFVALALIALSGAPGAGDVVALLAAIAATSLFELPVFRAWRVSLPLALVAATLVFPSAALATLPVAAYDLARVSPLPLRAVWVVPLAGTLAAGAAPATVGAAACASLLAFALSLRTGERESLDLDLHRVRDDLEEKVIDLDASRRELIAARDAETHEATLAERARISREIHDTVGHLLTRSILQVEALEVVHDGDEQTTRELEGVAATLREALDTTRATVHAMADEAFDLEADLRRTAETSGIPHVEVVFDAGETPLPAAMARCVSAVVREALTNAARHAHATTARVRVSEFPAILQVVVTNDGDVPARAPEPGMGLATMRERVEALAGTLRVSADGRTFTVFASLPKPNTSQNAPAEERP